MKHPADADPFAIERAMGLKPLSKVWAKFEILLGLAAAWWGLQFDFLRALLGDAILAGIASLALFVLGGYLAMAGSRSHLYQSLNRLTQFLWRELGQRK